MRILETHAAVAGTPGFLVIVGPDPGKGALSLFVSKPSPNDLLQMHRWVLSQPLPGGTGEGLSSGDLAGLKPEHQLILLREYAKAKGQRRAPTEGEIVELVYSPAGAAMQVWLAARRHEPTLTRAMVEEYVTEANYEQVMLDLDAALGANAEGETDPKGSGGPA